MKFQNIIKIRLLLETFSGLLQRVALITGLQLRVFFVLHYSCAPLLFHLVPVQNNHKIMVYMIKLELRVVQYLTYLDHVLMKDHSFHECWNLDNLRSFV